VAWADVNGDGFDDAIVGADSYNGGQKGEGRAYLGSPTGLGSDPVWIRSLTSNTPTTGDRWPKVTDDAAAPGAFLTAAGADTTLRHGGATYEQIPLAGVARARNDDRRRVPRETGCGDPTRSE
jgi:hypothetical protein